MVDYNGMELIFVLGTHVTFGVYIYRFGGLIDRCSALGVVYKFHLCSHSDACRVSGNCVCRHLTSTSFRRTL